MTEPDPSHPEIAPPSQALGRFLAGAVLALFVMVGLGIYWVWQRADREHRWRESINASQPLTPPPVPAR